jgi:hypothetical protein
LKLASINCFSKRFNPLAKVVREFGATRSRVAHAIAYVSHALSGVVGPLTEIVPCLFIPPPQIAA